MNMRTSMARRALGRALIVAGAWIATACGGDQGPEVDPAVAAFVGTWDADSLTVTNDANMNQVANVLDTLWAGSFFITVEPSGQYTASLTVFGQPAPEIGRLRVINGSTLSLTPSFPAGQPVSTASYVFVSDDRLILDGATQFDFNRDGIAEAAQAHFELERQ